MTIGENRENFGNFDENRPPQAVEICVFALFSRLPGVASPFDTRIIYILDENRVFAPVLYLKTRHFQDYRGPDKRSRLRPAYACRIVLLYGLLFK